MNTMRVEGSPRHSIVPGRRRESMNNFPCFSVLYRNSPSDKGETLFLVDMMLVPASNSEGRWCREVC